MVILSNAAIAAALGGNTPHFANNVPSPLPSVTVNEPVSLSIFFGHAKYSYGVPVDPALKLIPVNLCFGYGSAVVEHPRAHSVPVQVAPEAGIAADILQMFELPPK
jgi:hypothetical protein